MCPVAEPTRSLWSSISLLLCCCVCVCVCGRRCRCRCCCCCVGVGVDVCACVGVSVSVGVGVYAFNVVLANQCLVDWLGSASNGEVLAGRLHHPRRPEHHARQRPLRRRLPRHHHIGYVQPAAVLTCSRLCRQPAPRRRLCRARLCPPATHMLLGAVLRAAGDRWRCRVLDRRYVLRGPQNNTGPPFLVIWLLRHPRQGAARRSHQNAAARPPGGRVGTAGVLTAATFRLALGWLGL